ncbi:hypothetical protein [uncultured Clostridium sp.]|uniref:hypothetical protein n=1 Tax=uncultured Clostridium sp. TaxID=59620 RepID=UPI002615289F|nr:hypothetical protein [uncultured Clostridium sp.]
MQDLYIDSQGGFNFEIATDNKALRSRLGVFLSIRASNGYDDGELDYDINQGLDYEFLLDGTVKDEFKSTYIYNQIKNYYKEVEDVKNINIISDKNNRTLNITFEFKSIFDNDYIKQEVSNIV